MEPISKEEIEQIDDFIFHLSADQLNEWKEDYKRKQPLLYKMFSKRICKTPEEKDNMFRIILTVMKCFDVYGVALPVFTEKEISKIDAKWKSTITLMEKDNIKPESYYSTAATVNQEEISKYIYEKYMQLDETMPGYDAYNTMVKINTLNVVLMMYSIKIDESLRRRR